LALSIAYWLSVIGRYLIRPEYHLSLYLEISPVIILFSVVFWLQGLYPGLLIHPAEEIRRIFTGFNIVALTLAANAFLWKTGPQFSRFNLLAVWILGIPLVLCGRYAIRIIAGQSRWWGLSAVVIGQGPAAAKLIRRLRARHSGLRIAGVLTNDDLSAWDKDLPPILGDFAFAPCIATSGVATYAIVALPHASNSDLRHLVEDCCRGFRHILLVPSLPGICSIGVSARDVCGEVGFELSQRLFQRRSGIAKRTLDILFSAFSLCLLSPLFFLVAAAIKLGDGGSIFYRQTRYGKEGKTFGALKFRTMAANADQILEKHLRENPEFETEWRRDHKLKADPRVTSIGRWLRRYSLDELPQLLNVLVSEMSLVGPRPIVHAEIGKYGRGYNLYSRVRPGITGLWQVSGRNNTSYQERVTLDEYYVRNWSVWLDYYILFRTIRVVLTADGAY
jgi:Undecaprenyl-phosphate galactose phosphotransferase WbaP